MSALKVQSTESPGAIETSKVALFEDAGADAVWASPFTVRVVELNNSGLVNVYVMEVIVTVSVVELLVIVQSPPSETEPPALAVASAVLVMATVTWSVA